VSHDPLIGRQLANFRIERLLGRGGMAQVYYGRDVKLIRPVAIKVIDSSYRGNQAYARRFVQEARTVAAWRHENIIQIYYADNEGDLYYFVMEYIEGLDLASLLARYFKDGELMPHADVIRIGRSIAVALDYAHGKGVVHRDVKPHNVMVATDDRVVLMDFGLALDSQQGTLGEVFGTPHYIAPEQARSSGNAVPQSDLYALGVILYEMLTGTLPYDDPSPTAVALQHLTLPLPSPRARNPQLNAETEAVLIKALGKKPEERYAKGYPLIDALEKALTAASSEAAPLPLLPAGVDLPARSLSSTTVAEKLVEYTKQTSTSLVYPEPALPPTKRNISTGEAQAVALADQRPPLPPPTPAPASRRPNPAYVWIGAAMVLSVFLAGLALALFLISASGDDEDQKVPTLMSESLATTETATQPASSAVLPTDLPTSTPALSPSSPAIDPALPSPTLSLTPTTVPTDTLTPTDTSVPINPLPPSFTPQPPTDTLAPPTATDLPSATPAPILEPTIKYPGGKHFTLFYNNNSFYIYNASGSSQRVSAWGFERILSDGSFANAFEGRRLAAYYGQIDHNWCASLELLERDAAAFVRPTECGTRYNIRLTPQDSDSFVFWTSSGTSTQFRVLWNGEEIARCEMAAGRCEVYLP
jgi:serine/threonine protein kinase